MTVHTATVIRTLISQDTDRAIQKALGYFRRKIDAGESLGDGAYRNHSSIIALVGMAFLSSGSTPTEGEDAAYIAHCVNLLLSQARPGGVIASENATGQSLMYGNGFALTFLAECYGMSPEDEKIADAVRRSVRMLISAQNEEGGWRYAPTRGEADTSVTACVVMALRAAKNAGFAVPADVMENAQEYLKKCQNPDGGFRYRATEGGSAFPRSAAAIAALCAAGHYEGDDIRRGLTYLKNTPNPADDGYFFYAHYYAIQAFWLADTESYDLSWQAWYRSAGAELIKIQKPDGTWLSTISQDHATAMAAITLQVPNHALPILQR